MEQSKEKQKLAELNTTVPVIFIMAADIITIKNRKE